MAEYVKWNCQGLENGSEELVETMRRMTSLAEELRSVHRQLEPQIASYEGIGRTLRTLVEGSEEDARRVRCEGAALKDVAAVYANAELAAMRASESLPTSITERNLIFESWFSELLKS